MPYNTQREIKMTTADLKKKLTAIESDIHSHEREIYNLEAKKREIEFQLAESHNSKTVAHN